MSQPWFCALKGQSTGPHTDQQVRAMAASGTLGPQDLVWRDGMTQWVPAGSVPGLLPDQAAQLAAAAVAQPTGMLSYATPVHLAPPPGTAGPVVPPDDGPFLRLGRSFGTGKGMWTGNVVASPRAFY